MNGSIRLEFVQSKLIKCTHRFTCEVKKKVSLLQTHIPHRCLLAGKPSSTHGAQSNAKPNEIRPLAEAATMVPARMTELSEKEGPKDRTRRKSGAAATAPPAASHCTLTLR